MTVQAAIDEYALALRQGQKEYRELLMSGRNPHPAVLDEILPEGVGESAVDVGLVEIPAERIIGVKTAGRITRVHRHLQTAAGFQVRVCHQVDCAVRRPPGRHRHHRPHSLL